jgi:hypothetical protein
MFARLLTSGWPGESCFKAHASSILPRTLRSSEHALVGIQASAALSERAPNPIRTQGSVRQQPGLHPGLRSLTPSAYSQIPPIIT